MLVGGFILTLGDQRQRRGTNAYYFEFSEIGFLELLCIISKGHIFAHEKIQPHFVTTQASKEQYQNTKHNPKNL